MQLQSLGEPLVLKAVETVQQAVVEQVQGGSNDLDGDHGEDLALHQEDDLHHNQQSSKIWTCLQEDDLGETGRSGPQCPRTRWR